MANKTKKRKPTLYQARLEDIAIILSRQKDEILSTILSNSEIQELLSQFQGYNFFLSVVAGNQYAQKIRAKIRGDVFVRGIFACRYVASTSDVPLQIKCNIDLIQDDYSSPENINKIRQAIIESAKRKLLAHLRLIVQNPPKLKIPSQYIDKEIKWSSSLDGHSYVLAELEKIMDTLSTPERRLHANDFRFVVNGREDVLSLCVDLVASVESERFDFSAESTVSLTEETEMLVQRIEQSELRGITSTLLERIPHSIEQELETIPVKVDGPFSQSANQISAIIPKGPIAIGSTQGSFRLGLGNKKVSLHTMADGSRYLVTRKDNRIDKAIPTSALAAEELERFTAAVDSAANEYLGWLNFDDCHVNLHAVIEAKAVPDYSCPNHPASLQERAGTEITKRVFTQLSDKSGFKGGYSIASDSEIENATRNAIFRILKEVITPRKEQLTQRWFETRYHTQPFIQKCVLYAIQNSEPVSTTTIIASLKKNLGIGPDMVQETLEILSSRTYLPSLPGTLLQSRKKVGKYSVYTLYDLSDAIKSAGIRFSVPEPETLEDAAFFATREARANAVSRLAGKVASPDQAVEFVLSLLNSSKPDTFKKFSDTEQGLRILALLSAEDRQLIQYTLETMDGFKSVAKKLFS